MGRALNQHTRYIAISPTSWGTAFDDPAAAIRICRKGLDWRRAEKATISLYAISSESTVDLNGANVVITHRTIDRLIHITTLEVAKPVKVV